MSKVLIFNVQTGEPVEYLESADTPKYIDRVDAIINPDTELLKKPFKYLKVVGGLVQEKSAAEKQAADDKEAAASVNPFLVLVARVDALEIEIEKLKKAK